MYRVAVCVGVLVFSLSGCTTMKKAECVDADWQQVGYQDGREGQPLSKLAGRKRACSLFGISVDKADYRAGWTAGISEYCRPDQGLALGRAGGSTSSACPETMADDFQRAFRLGSDLGNAEVGLKDTDQDYQRVEQALIKLEDDINDIDETVDRADSSRLKRFLLIKRGEMLRRQFERQENQLFRLEQRRWFYRDEIQRVQAQMEAAHL